MLSCHDWPPWASGTSPAAFSLSSAANSSSIVRGSAATPAFFSAAFEYQIHAMLWILTGAA